MPALRAARAVPPRDAAALRGDVPPTTGAKFQVVLQESGTLGVILPGQPFQALVPWKPRKFRVKEFSDMTVEFVAGSDGRVMAVKQIDPSGE